jgi:hypothetical protein
VNVTAQLPKTPGWYERLWMMQNDHPLASQGLKTALGGAIPILPTVFGIANMYERYKHGQPLLGKTMGNLGGTVSNIFSGLGSGPGGPLSSNDQNPLYKDLDSSFFDGSGSPGGGGFGTSYYDSKLPDYPGLTGLSAYPLSGDVGGYWNQRAIHDAAPAYGPFSNFKG